jgi:undecaprenyl-diphosphatase
VTDAGVTVVEAAEPAIERSPSDLLRLVVAAVLLVVMLIVQALFGDTLVTFAAQLLRGLDALPSWILHTVVVGTRVLGLVVLGGGLVAAVWHRRWRLLLTVLVAGVGAVLLAWLLDSFAPESGASVVELDEDLVGPLTAARFPTAAGVAAVSAVLTAAAPWLSRRWRRLGWVVVAGVALTRFVSAPVSFDTFRNLLVGWLVGAAVLVTLGGPRRRPSAAAVAGGLAAVGTPLQRLEQASVDARGSTAASCSSRPWARISAAPTCCSASTGR